MCVVLSQPGGTPFGDFFVYVGHCLKKSVLCLNSQHSFFPGPFPFSMLGQSTHLLLSSLAGPAFFPPSHGRQWCLTSTGRHFPGAGATQTLKLGGRKVRIQVSASKRETRAGSTFCFGLYCHFCFVKLSGDLLELVG